MDEVREVQKTGQGRERKRTQRLTDLGDPHLALANYRRGNPTDYALLSCETKRITHEDLANAMVDINKNCKNMSMAEYIKYMHHGFGEKEVWEELIWFTENEHLITNKKKVRGGSRPSRGSLYTIPEDMPVNADELLLHNHHPNKKIRHIDPDVSMRRTLLSRNSDDGDLPCDEDYIPNTTLDDPESDSDSDQAGESDPKSRRAATVAARKERQPLDNVQDALLLIANGNGTLFVSVGSSGNIVYRVRSDDSKIERLPMKSSTFLKICQTCTPSHGHGVMVPVQSMFQSGFFTEVVQKLTFIDVPPTRKNAGIVIDTDFFQGEVLPLLIDEIVQQHPESTNALKDVISIMTDPSLLTAFVNKTGSALPTLASEKATMREMKALTSLLSHDTVVQKFEAEFNIQGLSKEGRDSRKNRGDVLKAMGVVDDRYMKTLYEDEADRMLDQLAIAMFNQPDLTLDQIDPTLKIWIDLSKLDGTLSPDTNIDNIIERSKKAKRMCDALIKQGGCRTRLVEQNFKVKFDSLARDLSPSVKSAVDEVRKQHPDLFKGYEKFQELDTYYTKGCMRDFPSCLDSAFNALKAAGGHSPKIFPVLKTMIENVLKKNRCPNNFHDVWARFQGTVTDSDRMDYSQIGMSYWEAAYKDLMLFVGKEVNTNDKTHVEAIPNPLTPVQVIESIIVSGFMAVLSELSGSGSSDEHTCTGDCFYAKLEGLDFREDTSPKQKETVCEILESFARGMSMNKLLKDNTMSLRHVPMDTYVQTADRMMDYARCNDELATHLSDLRVVYPSLKLRMVKHAMASILNYVNHPQAGISKAALTISVPMDQLFFQIKLDLTEDDLELSSPTKEKAQRTKGKDTSGKQKKKRNSDQISDGDKQSEPPEPTQKNLKVTGKPPKPVEQPAPTASVQPQDTGARGAKPAPANKSRKLSTDTINSLLPLVVTELKELLGQHGCQIPADRIQTLEGIIKTELGRPKCTTTHPASVKIPSPEHGIRTFSDMTDYLRFPSVDADYYNAFQQNHDLSANADSQRRAFLVQIAIKLYSTDKTIGTFPDCLRKNFMRSIL